MSGVRRFAIVTGAAATVAVGSLAAPQTASAVPISCEAASMISAMHLLTVKALVALGQNLSAHYFYGLAEGVRRGACG